MQSYTTDDLYKAIADQEIAFDLYTEDLGETNRALVYRDQTAMEFFKHLVGTSSGDSVEELAVSIEVGATVDYDGNTYTITMVGKEKVLLEGPSGHSEIPLNLIERFHLDGKLTIRGKQKQGMDLAVRMPALSPKEIAEAARRYELLERAEVDPDSMPVSRRTLQRWRKKIREAGEYLMDQKVALATKYGNCGLGIQRIPTQLVDLIGKVVRERFNTPDNISKAAAFRFFEFECASIGLKPCTIKTFTKWMQSFISNVARIGKKAAYQCQPITWYLNREDRIHGSRPWQYVHVDHTPLEIFLRGPRSRKKLGKPWLTIAIDAESRAILGFVISFEKPSNRTCMMLLRDMVRRHHRLPETLVLDNGKEFHSKYLRGFCWLYGITIANRPVGQPRSGLVVERIFGTTHTQLIRLLRGNSQLLKDPRAMSQSVSPEGRETWTLFGLHYVLEHYFDNIYGKKPHPAHRDQDYTAPIEHYNFRMLETGMRNHRLVRYDAQFLIETCPEPDGSPTRQVDNLNGIKVNCFHYQNSVFHSPKMDKRTVQVRVDPWDFRFVYALVDNEWYRCVSKEAMRLRAYTEVERRYANARVREATSESGVRPSGEGLAEWMKIHDVANFDPILAEQQYENARLHGSLGMTDAQCLDQKSMIEDATMCDASNTNFGIATNEHQIHAIDSSNNHPDDREYTEVFDDFEEL